MKRGRAGTMTHDYKRNGTIDRFGQFGILDTYRGVLVRDDYGGYLSYDDLAGVRQCLAHALRYLDDVHAIDPTAQAWAGQVADTLREAISAVNTARADGATSLHPRLLARLRRAYDSGVTVGISTNTSRRWHNGNHTGLQLAQTTAPQGRPAVDLRDPVRRPRHEQRIRDRHPRLQAGRQGQRMLAHAGHPAAPLPDPLLPDQLPQPRTPTPRRDHRRPHRHTLDATNHSLIN
jgi:hypothetical protein